MLSDLRRLRQFVAVAEVGSFTGAAATLHLSQQALSASVRQLETELRCTLFRREGRRIFLTPAGHSLLREAQPLLAAARTVADHVHAAAAGEQAWTVGHSPALTSEEVYALIEPAIDAFPAMSFTLRQLYPDELTAAVLDGSVQLGLRRGIAPAGALAAAVVGYHRLRVAVPKAHRLATADRVVLADLAGEHLALWAAPGASYFSDYLVGNCRRAGFEPDYTISRVQGAAMVAAPLTTAALAFVTAPAGPAMDGRVVVVDLDPPHMVPAQALWQRHTVSPVRELIVNAKTNPLPGGD
jgi:DNA-binding transcriptional LysR family regulator